MGFCLGAAGFPLECYRGLVALVAAPSLSPPSNASITGSVGRGGEVSSGGLENPDPMRPVPAGKQVGAAGSLVLSTSHRPMGPGS